VNSHDSGDDELIDGKRTMFKQLSEENLWCQLLQTPVLAEVHWRHIQAFPLVDHFRSAQADAIPVLVYKP
jgi:hypothetical protein